MRKKKPTKKTTKAVAKLETTTNSRLDLVINKEDIIAILISEKEEQIKHEINITKNTIVGDQEVVKQLKEAIHNEIAQQCGVLSLLKSGKCTIDSVLNTDYSKEFFFEHYDVSHLSQLKRPDLSSDRSRNIRYLGYKFNNKTYVYRDITTKEGFSGRLQKEVILTKNPKLDKLLDELNKADFKMGESKQQLNRLEYELIMVDHDKTIRAEILKKVLNTTDYKTLLLGN